MSTRLSNLVPATGWRAVVEVDGKPEAFHFAVWALRSSDDGDMEEIVGIAPGTRKEASDIIDDLSNFAFFIHDSDSDSLEEAWENWKKRT